MTEMEAKGWSPPALPEIDEVLEDINEEPLPKAKPSIAAVRGRLKFQKVIQEGRHAQALPPLKRILVQEPQLFASFPKDPPVLRGESFERPGPCPTCHCLPHKGWGQA